MIPIQHRSFLKAVLLHSVSAFGGPQGHLGMMLNTFAEKRKDLTPQELLNINTFCQLLPGATSTQTLVLIGYKRGGTYLAFLTLLVWVLPAASLMTLLSFLVVHQNTSALAAFTLLQPMALGFLAFAATKAIVHIAPGLSRILLLASAIVTFVFFKTPWVFPLTMILAGFLGSLLGNRATVSVANVRHKPQWIAFFLFATFFFTAAFLSETARKKEWAQRTPYNLFENMYRFGSFVFGGADVLIPVMYEQYVTRPNTDRVKSRNQNAIKLDAPSYLTGAGFVRAIPGPSFSIVAFVGGLSMQGAGWEAQVLGAAIATFGIFLPSFLLVLFFFPLWENLHTYGAVQRTMVGINAAVVGIMLASTVYLTQDMVRPLLDSPPQAAYLFFAVMGGTFLVLYFTRIPAPFVVLFCLALGFYV